MNNKVIIEVTATGHKTTVFIDGNEFTESWIPTTSGSKCIEGDFEAVPEISEELYEALTGFFRSDIMNALDNLATDQSVIS